MHFSIYEQPPRCNNKFPPPASEVSRKIENLTLKNIHTPTLIKPFKHLHTNKICISGNINRLESQLQLEEQAMIALQGMAE